MLAYWFKNIKIIMSLLIELYPNNAKYIFLTFQNSLCDYMVLSWHQSENPLSRENPLPSEILFSNKYILKSVSTLVQTKTVNLFPTQSFIFEVSKCQIDYITCHGFTDRKFWYSKIGYLISTLNISIALQFHFVWIIKLLLPVS